MLAPARKVDGSALRPNVAAPSRRRRRPVGQSDRPGSEPVALALGRVVEVDRRMALGLAVGAGLRRLLAHQTGLLGGDPAAVELAEPVGGGVVDLLGP